MDSMLAQGERANQRRRLPQFSLRAVMLVIATSAAWLAYYCHLARQQQDAVAVIRLAGGEVKYTDGDREPNGFEAMLGIDFLRPVKSVRIDGRDAEAMGRLIDLPSLTDLRVEWATDETMSVVSKLQSLHELTLDCGNVSDAGIAKITRLRQLESVGLVSTDQLTDVTFEKLAELPSLKDVTALATHLSSEGMHRFMKRRPEVKIYGW